MQHTEGLDAGGAASRSEPADKGLSFSARARELTPRLHRNLWNDIGEALGQLSGVFKE